MHFGIVLEEEELGIAAGSPALAVEARGLPEMLLEDLGEILAVYVAAALGDFRNGQAAPGQEVRSQGHSLACHVFHDAEAHDFLHLLVEGGPAHAEMLCYHLRIQRVVCNVGLDVFVKFHDELLVGIAEGGIRRGDRLQEIPVFLVNQAPCLKGVPDGSQEDRNVERLGQEYVGSGLVSLLPVQAVSLSRQQNHRYVADFNGVLYGPAQLVTVHQMSR